MSEPDSETQSLSVGDLTGVGKIVNSKIARKTYDDAVSPAMKQVGGLTEDTLKTFRLFTLPLQLAAAYQDRFRAFCDKVRHKVPEEHQCDAPPEIAKPVMEAFVSTRDESPLMGMFEELMAKAIDKREADKLSPQFPKIISSLSPLQALLISDLVVSSQVTDDILMEKENLIIKRVAANFDFNRYGDQAHHLTLVQNLVQNDLVNMRNRMAIDKKTEYPNLVLDDGQMIYRTSIQLSMFGKWFASACVSAGRSPNNPR